MQFKMVWHLNAEKESVMRLRRSTCLSSRESIIHLNHIVETRLKAENLPVGLHKDGGSKVFVGIPPVGWTTSTTTSTQDAFIQTIELFTLFDRLVELFLAEVDRSVLLDPRLDGSVLSIEQVHVGNQVLDNVHVRQRVNLGGLAGVCVDVADARQSILTSDVHCAGSADTFTARTTEGESGIDFVLDLDQSIQNHGSAFVKIDVVLLQETVVFNGNSIYQNLLASWVWIRRCRGCSGRSRRS